MIEADEMTRLMAFLVFLMSEKIEKRRSVIFAHEGWARTSCQ